MSGNDIDYKISTEDQIMDAITHWCFAVARIRETNINSLTCTYCHNGFADCAVDEPIAYRDGIYHHECYNEIMSEKESD